MLIPSHVVATIHKLYRVWQINQSKPASMQIRLDEPLGATICRELDLDRRLYSDLAMEKDTSKAFVKACEYYHLHLLSQETGEKEGKKAG